MNFPMPQRRRFKQSRNKKRRNDMEQNAKRKFKRIENAINQLPEFRNQVKNIQGMVCTKVLMITQENNVFSIHIRLGTDPWLIAKLVHHLSRKFDVEIGDPCFLSEDYKMYWGEEAMRAYDEFCASRSPEPINEELLRKALEQYDLEGFHSEIEN
jgi:hypothetical protein